MDSKTFETTIGYPIGKHDENYIKKNISNNLRELRNSNVVPFTLSTFLAIEAGEGFEGDIKGRLFQVFGDSAFAELEQAVAEEELTKEAIEELRKKIEEEMLSMLGPLKWILVDIPFLSNLEDDVADWALGEEIEEIRDAVSNLELPESVFEPVCEVQ